MFENLIYLFGWLILFFLPMVIGAWWTERRDKARESEAGFEAGFIEKRDSFMMPGRLRR